MNEKILIPSFKEALKFWFKLGFISFGGPAGQISIMHEYVVEKMKWISEIKFLNALNYCMLLPGPEAQQLATYIGWIMHKNKGGLAAGILFVLPSVFILLILSVLYVNFGNIPIVYSFFSGLKPAIVAIVLTALLKISKKSLTDYFNIAIAVSSFTAIYFFHIEFPVIIISTILISLIKSFFFDKNSDTNSVDDIVTETRGKFKPLKILTGLAVFFILWIIPLVCIRSVSNDFVFWNDMIMFFTKSAFVTFGGAYSVLTYVAQVAVNNFNWLSSSQMIDGLALGETTPGPLIMVLTFVGFMGGYNHFDSSVISGTMALIVTTYYTFLPSFMFIFTGAPLIEYTQSNKKILNILKPVTAAVTGVILNLCVYFAVTVIFPVENNFTEVNFFGIIWILVSFVMLQFYNVNIMKWIAVSAIAGLIKYLLI